MEIKRALTVVVALALAFAACSSEESGTPDPQVNATATGQDTAAPTETISTEPGQTETDCGDFDCGESCETDPDKYPDFCNTEGATLDVASEVQRRLADGELCEDTTNPDGSFEQIDVQDGVVAVVICDTGAYQSSFDLLFVGAEDSAPVQAYSWDGSEPQPVSHFVGNVTSTNAGLRIVRLDRGIGDCGDTIDLADFGNGSFGPVEVRAQTCGSADPTGPDGWPVVWTAGE